MTTSIFATYETIFILGAADPEMNSIEKILNAKGLRFIHAVNKLKRCHPGNVYDATLDAPQGTPAVLIECVTKNHGHDESLVYRIDHHNPGDPGYNCGPEEFWQGSSIGQLCELIGVSLLEAEEILGVNPLLIAAGDHCPAAAYRSECPGVDVDALMAWRAETRAAFQKRSVSEVIEDVLTTSSIVEENVTEESYIGGILSNVTSLGEIPELPEASLRTGVPVLYRLFDKRAEQWKEGLLGGSPEQVNTFKTHWESKGYKPYGVPVRGFAGVMLDK